MRLTGISEDPRTPGYGVGTWEDGSTNVAPIGTLREALTAQEDEERERLRAQNMLYNPSAQRPASGPDRRVASNPGVTGSAATGYEDEAAGMSVPGPAPQATPAPRQAPAAATEAEQAEPTFAEQYINAPVAIPYRPAYDPEKDDASRRPVRTGQVTERTGTPFTEDQQEVLQRTQDLRQLALQSRLEADTKQADADRYGAVLREQAVKNELRDRQLRQRQAEELYRQEEAETKAEAQALAKRKIDPTRMWSSKSTWQQMALVLASGLSGYSAGNGTSPVLGMIRDQQDEDIRVQEAELRESGGRVDNALRRLSEKWGSLEAGRDAVRLAQNQSLIARAGVIAAQTKIPQVQAAYQQLANELEAQGEESRLNLMRAAEGQVSERETAAMVGPRAASGGGTRAPTLQEKFKRAREVQGYEKGEADLDKTRAETGRITVDTARTAAGGLSPEKLNQSVEKYGEQRTKQEKAIATVREFMKRNGIRKNPDTGNWEKSRDIPGVGVYDSSKRRVLKSDDDLRNEAELQRITGGMVFDAFGAANPAQWEMMERNLKGSGTEDELVASLGSILDAGEAQVQSLDKSFDPEVVDTYNRRHGTGQVPGQKGRY